MRCSFAMLLFVGMLGCGDFEEAMDAERQPSSAAGILPVDQMDGDIENIAKGNGQTNNGGAAQPNVPVAKNENSIPKVNAQMVDMKAAMAANSNLVVIDNKITGSDPLSVTASAYVSMRSRPGMLAFKSNLNTWKAINDNRNPIFKEFQEMAKGLQFAALHPYRMYGYDVDNGGLVILEDRAMKKQRFEELGIPFEE